MCVINSISDSPSPYAKSVRKADNKRQQRPLGDSGWIHCGIERKKACAQPTEAQVVQVLSQTRLRVLRLDQDPVWERWCGSAVISVP